MDQPGEIAQEIVKRGILKIRQSRAAFLGDSSHRIVFHYTPKRTSWMNQVEIWWTWRKIPLES